MVPMASNISCSLTIYEAKANNGFANPAAVAGGIIEIRMKLRYRLCVKAYNVEFLVEDIVTPEFSNLFAMPLTFLLPEFSVMLVSNMLASLNIDAKVRHFSSPKIAQFAVDVAKRHGATAAVSGFKTVALLSVNKIDYIREEEFDRISRTLKLEDISGSQEKLHVQDVKSEENS